MKKNEKQLFKRFLSAALAIMVAVTFTPLFSEVIYADDEESQDIVLDTESEDVADGTSARAAGEEDLVIDVEVPDDEEVTEGTSDIEVPDVRDITDPDADEVPADTGNADLEEVQGESVDADSELMLSAQGDINAQVLDSSVYENLSLSRDASDLAILHLSGSIKAPYTFGALYVDEPKNSVSYSASKNKDGGYSISASILLSKYETGDHTIYLELKNGNQTDTIYWDKQSGIYLPVPNYNGVFSVNSTTFDYYPYDFGKNLEDYKLYMEYSTDGKTWKRTGYMTYNLIKLYSQQGFSISGLKANTTYRTRIRYGIVESSNGTTLFYGGPFRNTTTIKTGKSEKPKASIVAKAVKMKKHKVRWPASWTYVGGTAFYHKAWTERYYTYKIKVTVKFKKKPGTKGIFINGKWVKGNKKKYTATFTPSPNYSSKKPKGRVKVKVQVRTGQSKSYGGYSPAKTKKMKLK